MVSASLSPHGLQREDKTRRVGVCSLRGGVLPVWRATWRTISCRRTGYPSGWVSEPGFKETQGLDNYLGVTPTEAASCLATPRRPSQAQQQTTQLPHCVRTSKWSLTSDRTITPLGVQGRRVLTVESRRCPCPHLPNRVIHRSPAVAAGTPTLQCVDEVTQDSTTATSTSVLASTPASSSSVVASPAQQMQP